MPGDDWGMRVGRRAVRVRHAPLSVRPFHWEHLGVYVTEGAMAMTESELKVFDMIEDMREAQRKYFRLRQRSGIMPSEVVGALREARRMEEWVDVYLKEIRKGLPVAATET